MKLFLISLKQSVFFGLLAGLFAVAGNCLGQSFSSRPGNDASMVKEDDSTLVHLSETYRLEMTGAYDPDYYDKILSSFGRLDEFRLLNHSKKIEFLDGSGAIVVLSWKELGLPNRVDGKFGNRKVVFVINSNAQLKEQFLDD